MRCVRFLVAALLFASPMADAQISGNLSVVSDYRYRGMSLSQGNPEEQLSVGYDHPDGWYAGGLISGVDLYAVQSAQLITYGGYAGKIQSGWSWEGGISHTLFNRLHSFDYSEAYAGLGSESINVRLYYSPSYFNELSRTVYGELNANVALHDNLQLLFHGGILDQINSNMNGDSSTRFDYRVGLNARYNDWNGQLAWVGLQKKLTDYPQYEDTQLHSWVVSVSYSF